MRMLLIYAAKSVCHEFLFVLWRITCIVQAPEGWVFRWPFFFFGCINVTWIPSIQVLKDSRFFFCFPTVKGESTVCSFTLFLSLSFNFTDSFESPATEFSVHEWMKKKTKKAKKRKKKKIRRRGGRWHRTHHDVSTEKDLRKNPSPIQRVLLLLLLLLLFCTEKILMWIGARTFLRTTKAPFYCMPSLTLFLSLLLSICSLLYAFLSSWSYFFLYPAVFDHALLLPDSSFSRFFSNVQISGQAVMKMLENSYPLTFVHILPR